MRPETRYAKSGDISLAYQVIGDGPLDFVVVPGWISNVDFAWEDPLYGDWVRRRAGLCPGVPFAKTGPGASGRAGGGSARQGPPGGPPPGFGAAGSAPGAGLGVSPGGGPSLLFPAA